MRLGDLVYYFTKYTGIKFIVDGLSKYFGFNCGCEERRDKWNNIKGIKRW